MEHLKNTTELFEIKDPNSTILFVLKHQSHIEIRGKLDYKPPLCPHCHGKTIKYGFQKVSTIPILDVQEIPTILKLKKKRFQCKDCHRVTVAKTSLIKKNCQICEPVWKK